MTREEFDKIRFTGGMKAIWDARPYGEKEYDVANADFEDYTIGLAIDEENIIEVPCEEVTFTKL